MNKIKHQMPWIPGHNTVSVTKSDCCTIYQYKGYPLAAAVLMSTGIACIPEREVQSNLRLSVAIIDATIFKLLNRRRHR